MKKILLMICLILIQTQVAEANYCWKGIGEKEGEYGTADSYVPNSVNVNCVEYNIWVENKKVLYQVTERVNDTEALKPQYQTQIANLNIVINNSNYIQAKTNWTNAEVIQYMKVLAWHDEILAKGEMAILKILRWMLW